MNNTDSETSLSGDVVRYIRYQLRGRRGLIVGIVALGLPGLWIGWPWLVVAGVAPILIALAPCAIMCGFGLCAMKASSGAKAGAASCCSSKSDNSTGDLATSSDTENKTSDQVAALKPPQS